MASARSAENGSAATIMTAAVWLWSKKSALVAELVRILRIPHSHECGDPLSSMFGLLNLDKPAGLTSRDVVNTVQRLVRPHKAGHAGTLDPLATGVLVVALGPATRLIEYVQRMPKTY